MQVGAVIVAAGRGTRAGGGLPKQWQHVAGATVAEHSLRAFALHPKVSHLVLVLHPDDIETDFWPREPKAEVVQGGSTRGASVLAGLSKLEGRVDKVLIHDAARPCISQEVISAVIESLVEYSAAAPALAVVDALWRGSDGKVTGTAERDGLFRAQTPQGFDLAQIISAHRAVSNDAADDVEIARRAGVEVAITPGSEDNLKITMPEDFDRAELILKARHGR